MITSVIHNDSTVVTNSKGIRREMLSINVAEWLIMRVAYLSVETYLIYKDNIKIP